MLLKKAIGNNLLNQRWRLGCVDRGSVGERGAGDGLGSVIVAIGLFSSRVFNIILFI